MFSANRGDVVLPAKFDDLPLLTLQQIPVAPVPPPAAGAPPRGTGGNGGGARGPAGPFDGLYVSATRETSSGDVILKLVNIEETAQPLQIDLRGAGAVRNEAAGEMITGQLGDVNTVAEPLKVVPKAFTIKNAAPSFTHELPAHSVSVIRLKTR
jgi:hypothetical protein